MRVGLGHHQLVFRAPVFGFLINLFWSTPNKKYVLWMQPAKKWTEHIIFNDLC